MSGTKMDNKPHSPQTEPEVPDPADHSAPNLSSPNSSSPSSGDMPSRRESSLMKFRGAQGIYVGMRVLIYFAMSFVIFQLEGWVLMSLRPDISVLWWRLMVEGSMMIAAILPAVGMARLEGEAFGDFGLPRRKAFRSNFWIGALWGFGSLSILMFGLRVTGAFDFGSLALHGFHIWKFAAYYGVLFLLTALFEDFLMRGYPQWVLSKGITFWPAAALLSAAFGYIHGANPGESGVGLFAAGLIGFFLCLTLRRTGDLWWAVGFHMAWDWGESYFYSVPDSGAVLPGHLIDSRLGGPHWLSGGSVGPEGSYLVFVLIAVLWFLFDRAYPEVKYRVHEAPTAFRTTTG